MADTYVVKKGDTLSQIAEKYKSTYGFTSTYTYVKELTKINNLKNPDLIMIGQVIKLKGTADAVKPTTTSRVRIDRFGLQSNSDRTMFVTWTWSKSHTKHYEVHWSYYADGYWFRKDSTTEYQYSIYTAPSHAQAVKVLVKPISESRAIGNDTDCVYWASDWSETKQHTFRADTPTKPKAPTVQIENLKLTVTAPLALNELKYDGVQIRIIKDDSDIYKTQNVPIPKDDLYLEKVTHSCDIKAGSVYKARCRLYWEGLYGEWSDLSDNVGTPPSIPEKIEVCRAGSTTSVYLEWTAVNNAETYDIEYATEKRFFDISNSVSKIEGIKTNRYEITGLTTGDEYFFRVRAINERGESGWSEINSTAIGKAPTSPTTWTSTTTVKTGEKLFLYWVHNAEDNSRQTFAELEIYINGVKASHTIKNESEDEDAEKTSSFEIDTTPYVEGVKIQWRVRTAGVTKVYGDWSIQRTVDVYGPPTLELSVTDSTGQLLETLESFPFFISGLAAPKTQIPVGYHLSIVANDTYETTDDSGRSVMVSAGDTIYSKYFSTNESLTVRLSAEYLSLRNNISYTVMCMVHMNSGLIAEASHDFIVKWSEEQYEPNAEIMVDEDTYSVSIKPYCCDGNNELLSNIKLAVYRREFDGSLIEIASGLDNTKGTFVTDPHPALDYARYRIVATDINTGAVSYYDMPGHPVGGKEIVIQWNEQWTSFNDTGSDRAENSTWSGSMLKLPYNVDVSDSYNPDVALVEYIGRGHPVSYYGTQRGETSSWNAEIEKDDEETLYALRRLASWTGDVYVREPSGSGYWASVRVSFSQKHSGLTIPVTLDVTRVEGGV